MFHSLRAQISLLLLILIAILAIQVVLSRSAQEQLVRNEEALIQSYDNLGQVYLLERNVVDLQRTLLIYKDTGSESSSSRFSEIMKTVEDKLASLENLSLKNHLITQDKTELTSLRGRSLLSFSLVQKSFSFNSTHLSKMVMLL